MAVAFAYWCCGWKLKEALLGELARLSRECGAQHAVETERQTRNGVLEDGSRAHLELGGNNLVVTSAVVTDVRDVHDRGAGGRRVVNDAAPANGRLDARVDFVEHDAARAGEGRQSPEIANGYVVDSRRVGNVNERLRRRDFDLRDSRRAVSR